MSASKPGNRKAPRPAGTATASGEAQRRAAAILEVLAGVRTAPEAAAALKISVNHYYLLERKGLAGLVAACEPQPKGKHPDPQRELSALRQALQRSQRECQRQAALVRATQRAVGLPATPPPQAAEKPAARSKPGKSSSPRRRKTSARALRAARALAPQGLVSDQGPAVQPKEGSEDDKHVSVQKEDQDGTSRS